MAAAIGDMREAIGGLRADVTTLMKQWRQQDREANERRDKLHAVVNDLRLDVNVLQRDVAAMKPYVDAGTRAELQARGARNLLKVLWHVLSALLGAVVVAWFGRRY